MDISSLFLVGNKIDSVSKQTENLFSHLISSLKKNDLLKIIHTIGSDNYILENVGKYKTIIYDNSYRHLMQFLASYELTPQFWNYDTDWIYRIT